MSHDFEAMRDAMVESQLRPNAVDDVRIIRAMASVPREKFVPEKQRGLAYAEMMVSLGGGRRMNLPIATGRLLREVSLLPAESVLIVGAATGYLAALCVQLAASVVALEENTALLAIARQALANISNIEIVEGVLSKGWAEDAPYDAIIVDGAIDTIPQTMINQLAEGGRFAAALVEDGVTRLVYGRKQGVSFGTVAFFDTEAASLPGFERPKEFVF